MRYKSSMAVLAVLSLLVSVSAGMQTVKADSNNPLTFPWGLTINSPVNATYYSSSPLLDFALSCVTGVSAAHLNCTLDGIYPVNMTWSVPHPMSDPLNLILLGSSSLSQLSDGSHQLSVGIEEFAPFVSRDSLPADMPFQLVQPTNSNETPEFVASWIDTVYFALDTIHSPPPTPTPTPKPTSTPIPSPSPNPSPSLTEPNTWATLAPIPESKSEFGAAVVNGEIYAIGGYQMVRGNGYGVTGSMYMYDPATDEWSIKKDMPTPRGQFGIAVYQNKIYVIGGRLADGTITNVNEVYDPATDNWTTKAPIPIVRWGMQANVVGDKIYLISGFPGVKQPATILNDVYDPITDTWATKAPIPNAVVGYGSAVLDGKIYVIGGYNMITQLNLNQVYDTKTDTWSLSSPPPLATNGGAVAATTGLWAPKLIYLIGGFLGGSTTNTTQVYNPYNNTWRVTASMPTDRTQLSVAVLNDEIFAIGGNIINQALAANEQYIPIGYGTPDSTNQAYTPPPSSTPTQAPTASSTTMPTLTRTLAPTLSLSPSPTLSPSTSPSLSPSESPTQQPTIEHSPTLTVEPPYGIQFLSYAEQGTIIGSVIAIVVGLIVYFKKRKG